MQRFVAQTFTRAGGTDFPYTEKYSELPLLLSFLVLADGSRAFMSWL